MAKLSAGARNKLPGKDFAGPDRSFPVNDANHARLAKSAASRKVNNGTMSKGQESRIDAKADSVLKHRPGKIETVKTDRGEFGFRKHRG